MAWVPAGRGERDPQRFWASVTGALRQTPSGAGLVQGVSAAPDLDAGALVERLLADLARLDERLWLVIDDVHGLVSAEALRQLELLVMRAALAPVLAEPSLLGWPYWLAHAYVLEAAIRDALGDVAAAEGALERALDFAEPNGLVTPFLSYAAPGLLERHARRSSHASLRAEIQAALAGATPAPRAGPPPLLEALSQSELRVLRYLPTNLTTPEIARELSVSPNTVRTHIRNLYAKFGTHHRSGAVERARALGLLAPSRTAAELRRR